MYPVIFYKKKHILFKIENTQNLLHWLPHKKTKYGD